jgi:hypothetical protein
MMTARLVAAALALAFLAPPDHEPPPPRRAQCRGACSMRFAHRDADRVKLAARAPTPHERAGEQQ